MYVLNPSTTPKIGNNVHFGVHSVIPLVVTFAIFIFTRPEFGDLFRSISSVQNCNRFSVYLTIYRLIEIKKLNTPSWGI